MLIKIISGMQNSIPVFHAPAYRWFLWTSDILNRHNKNDGYIYHNTEHPNNRANINQLSSQVFVSNL